jgi:hypothetical protein
MNGKKLVGKCNKKFFRMKSYSSTKQKNKKLIQLSIRNIKFFHSFLIVRSELVVIISVWNGS